MWSDAVFGTSNKELVTIMLQGIAIYIIIQRLNLSIVSTIVVMIGMYILFQKKVYENYSNMEQIDNKLKAIDIDQYPHIKNDIDAVDVILKLKPLIHVDRIKYTELVECIDSFFKMYSDFQHIQLYRGMLYESAKDISKNALNTLLSFALSGNIYPVLEKNGLLHKTASIGESAYLEESVIKLKRIFSIYLEKMELDIEKEWNSGDTNNLSYTTSSMQPDPSVFDNLLFDKHYSIY